MDAFPLKRGPVWSVVLALLFVSVPPVAGEDYVVNQDDAGSGQDAPDGLVQGITVLPDVVYDAMSSGPVTDLFDVYHFVGAAGDTFQGWSEGNVGCYYLFDEQGNDVAEPSCAYLHLPINSGPLVAVLPYTGDYYFQVAHLAPALYRFGFSLTGDAPDVQTLTLPFGDEPDYGTPEPLPVPAGCSGDFVMVPGTLGEVERFTDGCYHMRTDLNTLDTPQIDVLIVPPVTPYPERDLRVMRQAVEMWASGIHTLANDMGLDWLRDGVDFDIFVDDDQVSTDPLWDPEIIVVATNPAGGAGIGIDPLDLLFGGAGPCHGQPNPLAGLDAWQGLPGFDSHHDGKGGTYSEDCEGGGSICYAVNGAVDPAPGFFDFFGLYDLVAHEFGHCLTVGHVGDALDHEADAVPFADIMAYTNQPHDKCVSTLDVESFALTMSRFLLETPLGANDANSPAGVFHIQHPDDHAYASPTGLAKDCPQPDADLVPGGYPVGVPLNDDAGSGQDAPDGTNGAVSVQPDVVYQGTAIGPLDLLDTYHVTATAGQTFQGWSDGNLGCYYLLDAQGNDVAEPSCSYEHLPINTGPLVAVLPYTGDYYFQVANLAPSLYHFAFSLNGPPPSVQLLDQI